MKNKVAMMALVLSLSILIACNKNVDDPVPNDLPTYPTGARIASLLDDPNYSLLKAAVLRASTSSARPTIAELLSDSTRKFTLFAPDNQAFNLSGISAAAINFINSDTLHNILLYHILPQAVPSTRLSSAPIPNLEYASLFNPAPALSPLLRLTTFLKATPSGAWINNVPIVQPDITFSNGIVHKVAFIVMPPSKFLWQTINTDTTYTYLKAAIKRADFGLAKEFTLDSALRNIGANLTIFAPTNQAFENFLTNSIKKYLVANQLPPSFAQILVARFKDTLLSNPGSVPVYGDSLAKVINPTIVRAIVSYHVISKQSPDFIPPGVRIFSVNIPTSSSPFKTLLNASPNPTVAQHPGVLVKSIFNPLLPIVSSATIKGFANETESNIIISAPQNPTHDLNHLNGVVHRIDQVLLPLPLSF